MGHVPGPGPHEVGGEIGAHSAPIRAPFLASVGAGPTHPHPFWAGPKPTPLSPRPNVALDELDRVAGRVADVDRTAATIPFDLSLDLDPTTA